MTSDKWERILVDSPQRERAATFDEATHVVNVAMGVKAAAVAQKLGFGSKPSCGHKDGHRESRTVAGARAPGRRAC